MFANLITLIKILEAVSLRLFPARKIRLSSSSPLIKHARQTSCQNGLFPAFEDEKNSCRGSGTAAFEKISSYYLKMEPTETNIFFSNDLMENISSSVFSRSFFDEAFKSFWPETITRSKDFSVFYDIVDFLLSCRAKVELRGLL